MIQSQQEARIRRAHVAREIIEVVLLVAIIFIAIRLSIGTFTVQHDSMEPNYLPGQNVIVNKLAYVFGKPQRGDVIVFYYPLDTTQTFIKRIIGVPGDTIVVTPATVSVDGRVLNEPYIIAAVNPRFGQITLGPNQYFVMGDNRPVSCDSRSWGAVPSSDIIGKVTAVYWPLNVLRGSNTYSSTFAGLPTIAPPSGTQSTFGPTSGCD